MGSVYAPPKSTGIHRCLLPSTPSRPHVPRLLRKKDTRKSLKSKTDEICHATTAAWAAQRSGVSQFVYHEREREEERQQEGEQNHREGQREDELMNGRRSVLIGGSAVCLCLLLPWLPPAASAASGADSRTEAEAETEAEGEGVAEASFSSSLAPFRDDKNGFSLLIPRTWVQKEKAGATALFEDGERAGASIGVVVSPVRIGSLRDFGSLEFVAEKLVQAERRKESTKAVEILNKEEEEKGAVLHYALDYRLESTRGNKRLLTGVAIARRKLYILNITIPEGAMQTQADADGESGGELFKLLKDVQSSFVVDEDGA